MRMEAKVYMSHTDMARIQEAAKRMGFSLSGYMRWSALQHANLAGVPEYRSLLEGQAELYSSDFGGPLCESVGGE